MAKKNKSKTASPDAGPDTQPSGSKASSARSAQADPVPAPPPTQPQPPTLVICRNKYVENNVFHAGTVQMGFRPVVDSETDTGATFPPTMDHG